MSEEQGTPSLLSGATVETTPTPNTPEAIPDPVPAQAVEPEGEAAPAEQGTEVAASPPPITADDLSLPEGFTVPEDLQGEFLELMNNPPESRAEFANRVLGMHTNLLQQAADEYASRWESLQEEWRTAVQNLPEIGGPNLSRSFGEIAKVLDKYGDKEVREALDATGAGNHPALVRLFYKIAKDLNEQPPVHGSPAVGQPRDRASRMYGNS